jgi:hypothetical protein
MIITTILGIVTPEALAIIMIIEESMSKKLTMLSPVIKITPFTRRNNPKIKIKLSGSIWKIPNNQKHIPIKISKIPNILIIIFYLIFYQRPFIKLFSQYLNLTYNK